MREPSNGWRLVSAGVALGAVLVAAGSADAQRVAASYGVAHSGHWLIGTLGGYELHATTQRLGLVSGTFSFGRHTGSHARNGMACGGLIPPPPACPNEPLRDETASTDVSGTLDVTLFERTLFGARIEGSAGVGAQVLHLTNHSRGETTGNRIGAERTKVGPTLGFELSAQPKAAVPVGLRFGIAGGIYGDTDPGVVDGYTPFEDGFSVTRFEVGLVWFIRR